MSFLILSLMMISYHTVSAQSKEPMIRMAEIEIDTAYREEYLAILKEEAAASLRLEPGVITIFPMYEEENPNADSASSLNVQEQSIVTIAAFTAQGNLEQLQKALNSGLDAGLTINETKEVLVHLYAYCGFPRSIRGLQTLMTVVEDRQAKGIRDEVGREATPQDEGEDKYEKGKKVLEELTGQSQDGPKKGYAAFSPIIEVFLKEHLFADIFGRDILTYTQREIATLSALISMGGVAPMVQGHVGIALNIGITEAQLEQLFSLIESRVGAAEAKAGREMLSQVISSNNTEETTSATIFPKGEKITNDNFVGTAWLSSLVTADSTNDNAVGSVTFAPGARTNWHLHPDGQIILATGGVGYYQEKDSPKVILRKGDVVQCPPHVPHWHGASPDSTFIQIAITGREKGPTEWLQAVTEEEYLR